MAALLARFEAPLRLSRMGAVRAAVVSGSALALIFAGQPLPF
jgi:hypothetical protein